MAVQRILRMGEPGLLHASQPVKDVHAPEIQALIQDLWDTMAAANGAGLAAPQIGVNLQVVVFGSTKVNPRYPGRELVAPTVLINPSVEAISDEVVLDWEGCLSIPGLRGLVPRANSIRYSGIDENGHRLEREAQGFHARVVQHECDHLWGTLYTMRMEDFSQFGYTDVLFPEITLPKAE